MNIDGMNVLLVFISLSTGRKQLIIKKDLKIDIKTRAICPCFFVTL